MASEAISETISENKGAKASCEHASHSPLVCSKQRKIFTALAHVFSPHQCLVNFLILAMHAHGCFPSSQAQKSQHFKGSNV